MTEKHIYYIPSSTSFIEQLSSWLIKKFDKLADLTILLPSTRACLALEKSIVKKSTHQSIILPQIIPIGQLGTEQFIKQEPIEILSSPLSYYEHNLYLTKLILGKFGKTLTYPQALNITTSLSEIILNMSRNNIPLEKLAQIFLAELPKHFEMLSEYLTVIAKDWPLFLEQHKKQDFRSNHYEYINKLISKWQISPTNKPIIIAGSTGSVPSTKYLIKAIASLPQGFVILNDINYSISNEEWHDISETHHAYYTKNLLESLNYDRKHLIPILNHTPKYSRQNFLSLCMLPSTKTWQWAEQVIDHNYDCSNLEIIECSTTHQEAMVVMLRIREILEKQRDAKIAIIGNNPSLIKHITSFAQLWNIKINDNTGTQVTTSDQYQFLSLLVAAIQNNFQPQYLIALLKNSCYQEISNIHLAKLEIKYLRGITKYSTLPQLIELTTQKNDLELTDFLNTLHQETKELAALLKKHSASFKQLLQLTLQTGQSLTTQNQSSTLWNNPQAIKVHQIFLDILNVAQIAGKILPKQFDTILATLLNNQVIYADKIVAQVSILSPLESRLLTFDYTIITGLNEGSWPSYNKTTPWLPFHLCKSLGLENRDQKHGQAAYHFFCLLQQPNLLITRAILENGNATTPSRWLLRLELIAGKLGILEQIKQNNHPLKQWYQQLYLPQSSNNHPNLPPPRTEKKITQLSVTQIEKLTRDPYSVYCSKILKLKKLDQINKTPDQREFGTFIHDIIDNLNKHYNEILADHTLFDKIALSILDGITLNQMIRNLWLLKFSKLKPWAMKFELDRRADSNIQIFSETKGKFELNNDFSLTMKADRIEVSDNEINIIDFKTGSIPSQQDIKSGFSPQLLLEALIVRDGELSEITTELTNKKIKLSYIQLSPRNFGKITELKLDSDSFIQEYKIGLTKLIMAYHNNHPYLICPRPKKEPTYNEIAHLERKAN